MQSIRSIAEKMYYYGQMIICKQTFVQTHHTTLTRKLYRPKVHYSVVLCWRWIFFGLILKKCENHLEETSETQGGGREDPCKRASNDAPTIFLFGFSSRPWIFKCFPSTSNSSLQALTNWMAIKLNSSADFKATFSQTTVVFVKLSICDGIPKQNIKRSIVTEVGHLYAWASIGKFVFWTFWEK